MSNMSNPDRHAAYLRHMLEHGIPEDKAQEAANALYAPIRSEYDAQPAPRMVSREVLEQCEQAMRWYLWHQTTDHDCIAYRVWVAAQAELARTAPPKPQQTGGHAQDDAAAARAMTGR